MGLSDPASVTQASVDGLAREGVSAVIDGVYTDNTGIAFAVAAGSTEVVAFLNGTSEESSLRDLVALFTGAQKATPSLPIFEQQAADVQEECSKFASLPVAETAKYLKSISFGTLVATTAATATKLWGITSGTSVTLKVVAVAAIGATSGSDDAHNFDQIVQEIVDAITANPAPVREQLLPWFQAA